MIEFSAPDGANAQVVHLELIAVTGDLSTAGGTFASFGERLAVSVDKKVAFQAAIAGRELIPTTTRAFVRGWVRRWQLD